jgi:ATP-dependent helicase HepA
MTDTFFPGQRWVSHADSTLGLGIVTQADERRVTLHFPAVEEERVYAIDRAPLTRLELKPGDQLTRLDGSVLTVTERHNTAGVLTYSAADASGAAHEVSEAELDAHIELDTPLERLLNNQLGKPKDFGLRQTTLEHAATGDGFGLQGLLGARTALLSHQLYVAATVGGRFAPRVLLADEVGLGKTIEAGLILTQQLHRQRAHRILILVPETLTHQWLVEMQRRFHLAFSLLNAARLEETDPEVEFADNSLVIAPISLFESDAALQNGVAELDWDMVVIDEAHHVTGIGEQLTPLGQFISDLSARSRGLLLLTATPEQAGLRSHFDRLQLIDPARFCDFEQFQSEQSQFAEWSRVIENLESGETVSLPQGIDADADPDQQIQQMLDRFGPGRVLFRNTRHSIKGFPTRHRHQHALPAPVLYADSPNALHPETRHDEQEWIAKDPRVSWLQEQLRALRPRKVLVICAHKETAMALEHFLHLKAGIRCAAFHEDLSLIERDRAAAYFSEEAGGAQALICSEIGSEGRNFQFAQHLICFDLPVHPDLLEQRIGRLDRIGQGSDIQIHVPYLSGTAQEMLFKWLDEGLNAFNQTCPVGHQLHTEFLGQLNHTMSGSGNLDSLIADTRSRRDALLRETEIGRDRLLERHSHNAEAGAKIIATLEERESGDALQAFSELLFDRLGLEQEYLDEHLWLLRPTENLATGQLPGLDEDGVTATYDRSTALSRDEVTFLTWEHPIIMETMAALLGSDIGKASIGTFKHRGVPAGTVLLESLHRVECLAPRHLEAGQFLEQQPLRMLLTQTGNEVGGKLSSQFLEEALKSVPSATSATALNKLKPLLEALMPTIEQRAGAIITERSKQAIVTSNAHYDNELSRLSHLQALNPLIRDDEIADLSEQKSACHAALSHTKAVLEGLRVCIAVN